MTFGIIVTVAVVLALLLWGLKAYRKYWVAQVEAESKRQAEEQIRRSQWIDKEVSELSDTDLDNEL